MNNLASKCPFEAGQYVKYSPSERGRRLDVMEAQPLTPGKVYRIKEIQKGAYVCVEGYSEPGGGIYWTEFESVK